jgi:hypothetical protein
VCFSRLRWLWVPAFAGTTLSFANLDSASFFPSHAYSAGSTKSVSSVALINPPITTVAIGRCTSAPVPVASAIGTNPRDATSAVIATGRSRVSAPSCSASSRARPCAINCLT